MIDVAKQISLFASPAVLTGLLIAAGVIASVQRRKQAAAVAFWLVTGNLLTPILKWLVARPRPGNALVLEAGHAFPSGHALAAAIFAGAVVAAAWYVHWRGWRLALVTVLASLFVGAVAGSRLILQVHWLSDVLGGIILGVTWVAIVLSVFRTISRPS